jgi:hypothetical protein
MSAGTNPLGKSGNSVPAGGIPDSPSRFERAAESVKSGLGGARDTIVSAASNASQWKAVKTVRNSFVWSWLSWPFSVIGSLLSGTLSRISKLIWGSPKVVSGEDKVTLKFKGYFWDSKVETTLERAIRKSWLTIDNGIKENKFTLDEAQTNGWVPVTFKGYVWNTTMMLKTAVETGKMTVEQAITDGHITEAQANRAKWLVKQ